MAFEYGNVNRQKVAATVSAEGLSKVLEFRLKPGVTQLRVLPPHVDSDVWFHRSMEHWVDGVGHVPCARQFGLPCPICESGEALYKNSENESGIKASLELRPREQYYYNVLVFSSPDSKITAKDGVKILRSGVKVFRQLKSLDNDEASGWGDITNPETGINVSISRSGKDRTDTEYLVSPVNSKGRSLAQLLESHSVDLNSLDLINLEEYARSLMLPYEELKLRFENKQVAPGFPGGPRLSSEKNFLDTEITTIVNDEDGDKTEDFVAPPTIKEN